MITFLVPLVGAAAIGVGLYFAHKGTKRAQLVADEKSSTADKKKRGAETPAEGSAQEFLGFKDIRDGFVELPGGRAMIIEVQGSVNYPLMSGGEQDQVEDAFASFLASMTVPFQFYVQSRLISMDKTIQFLSSQLERLPGYLRDYGESLLQYLHGWVYSHAIMTRQAYISVFVKDDQDAGQLMSIISGGLARCGLKARRLTTPEIMDMLYAHLNKQRANRAPVTGLISGMMRLFVRGERNPLVKGEEIDEGADFDLSGGVTKVHDIAPDGFKEFDDYIRVGPRYTRNYYVIELPGMVSIGFLDDLYTIDDVDVSIHFFPVKTYEAVKYLTKQITKLKTQRIQDEMRGDISNLSVLEKADADLWQLREKIQTNEDRLFYTSIIITVTADSLEGLDAKCRLLEARLGGRGVHVRSAYLDQAKAFKSGLPLAQNFMWDRRKNLNLGGAVSVFPFTSAELAHPGGVFIGRNLITGAPVFYDLFAGPPVLNNKHFVIMATTGAGKSYFTKGIASRSICYGCRVVFIDPEGEYAVLTKERGGQVIEFKPGGECLINPFDLEEEEIEGEGSVVNISEKILEIKRLVKVMIMSVRAEENLTTEETAALEEILYELYESRGITSDPASLYEKYTEADSVGMRKKEMPTITDLRQALETKGHGRLAQILAPYTRGKSLGLFDGQSKVSLQDQRMICFDFARLEEEFMRPLAMHVSLNWIWEKFAKKNLHTRKVIIADEAWMYMKQPDSAKFLNDVARRGRKRNVSLGVVTQYPQEFTSSEAGRAVLSSAASKFLMRQAPNDTDIVQDLFKLNEGQKKFIARSRVGEALVLSEGETGVFSTAIMVEASEQEDRLFNTDPERTLKTG